jgi:hypothetical protein
LDFGHFLHLMPLVNTALTKRREHIMSPFHLRILRILNLEPAVLGVNAHTSLGDHSLKVPFAHFLKQQLTVAFDVLSVENFRASAPLDQLSQLFFSLD